MNPEPQERSRTVNEELLFVVTLFPRKKPFTSANSGRKLDAKLDLRIGFGDYVHATVPNTDSLPYASRAYNWQPD